MSDVCDVWPGCGSVVLTAAKSLYSGQTERKFVVGQHGAFTDPADSPAVNDIDHAGIVRS
jgi:hypothetical protein